MPWLIYRLILSDLLRLIGLTASVLVTVIAFGATIKPLASDALLDASQTFKYMMLVIVPMLQFALPFAAGFGAAQALHRMTTDNEIQAMAVSGISYRRILLPVAALGLALSALMVLLTQTVIPQFWTLIAQTATQDITRVFQASIAKGEPFQIEKLQICARYIFAQDFPEGADGPATRMKLEQVAAATLDDQGRIETDVTARQAVADVYHRGGRTIIKLVMHDAVAFRPDSGQLAGSTEVRRTVVVPSALKDNPKTMTREELLKLRHNPDGFGQVISARETLAQAVRDARVRIMIDEQLHQHGRVELIGPPIGNAGEHVGYTVSADHLKDGQLLAKAGSRIDVVQLEGAAAVRRFSAETARLAAAGPDVSGTPMFDLTLENMDVSDLRPGDSAGPANKRLRLVIPNLTVENQPREDLLAMSSIDLMNLAATIHGGPEKLPPKISKVKNEIDSLQYEITGRLLCRYALSCTAFLLLMLGAVLSIWLRGSLPLTTYALAFMPSILDLILISAGEQLLRDGRMLGHVVMWSGNAIMVLAIGMAYLKLARH